MASETIKTRILIISDTHCAALKHRQAKDNFPCPPFEAPLPSADLLIHCGDLTLTGELEEYHSTLDMLKEIDAPIKLVIAGNHDLSLDWDFVFSHLRGAGMRQGQLTSEQAETRWKAARDLWTAENGGAKNEGITFLDEGVHHIALTNGAAVNVYASPYTPEFQDWGFPYERDEDRFNTPLTSLTDARNIAPYPVPSFDKAESPVDILITHGPPFAILDQTDRGDLAGCPHLLRAAMRARPAVHCFGHIHEGWGAKVLTWAGDADEVTTKATRMQEWKDGAWKAGIAEGGMEDVEIDAEEAKERHAAFLDLSRDGRVLERGLETAVINAAIMNVRYEPANAPWVVDVELPRAP